MPFAMIDSDEPARLQVFLDRDGEQSEVVLVDAAVVATAVLRAGGWTEEQLEVVGVTLDPGPEPHLGRWSCTLHFGAALPEDEYQRLRAAAVTALRARGYLVADEA